MDPITSSTYKLAGVKALILLATIVLGWLLLRGSELGEHLRDFEWVQHQVQEGYSLGALLFVVIGGACTVIGFPRLLLSTMAGFVFGMASGFFFALLGTLFGCVLSFYYARVLGRKVLEQGMSARMREIEALLVKHGFVASILIRSLPVSNNSIVNLLAGVTGVRPLHFFLGSALGYIPLTVVFVMVGSGIQQDLAGRVWLSVALLVLIVMPLGYLTQLALKRYTSPATDKD